MLYRQKKKKAASKKERKTLASTSFTRGSSPFTVHFHNPLPPNRSSSIRALGMRPAIGAATGHHQELKQANRKIAGGAWSTQTTALDATEP